MVCFDKSGLQQWRVGSPASLRAVNLSEDGRIAVVAMDDGTIRWLNDNTGEELLIVLFFGEHRDWVAWTPAGFFVGSVLGESVLGIHGLAEDGSVELSHSPDSPISCANPMSSGACSNRRGLAIEPACRWEGRCGGVEAPDMAQVEQSLWKAAT